MTKSALVTGGGRGVGKSIALRLAKDLPVLIVGRSESDLVVTQIKVHAYGGVCEYVVGDIADSATHEALEQKLDELGWEVDSLILNAGTWSHGSFEDFERSRFVEMLNVNFVANWDLLQRFLPAMGERQAGTVVLNCGVVGTNAYGSDAAYVAAKHALLGLASSLTRDYRKKKVRFVPFCTSLIEGDRTNAKIQSIADSSGKSFEETYERIAKQTPAGKIIPLEEFSEAVADACHPESQYRSGQVVTLAEAAA